jgi:hypothetical protein
MRHAGTKKNKYITIPRPEVIKLYNESMGGVDLQDMLIGLYRIHIRSKKWTLRLIFHAIDVALTNAWIEYKHDAAELKVLKKNTLDLLHFRLEVAQSLVLARKPIEAVHPAARSQTRRQRLPNEREQSSGRSPLYSTIKLDICQFFQMRRKQYVVSSLNAREGRTPCAANATFTSAL